ncbi:mucin-2-like [Anomaloglossus baeobatrachus]|uniref:mucin-2-like n=1 Tax=Anomaloglossus baeobatrachus TaxID=238106 RepID=UPI003F4FD424
MAQGGSTHHYSHKRLLQRRTVFFLSSPAGDKETTIERMEGTKQIWIVLIIAAFINVVLGNHHQCYQAEIPEVDHSSYSARNIEYDFVLPNNENVCSTWSIGNIKTFDGYFYNGKGNCTYIFAKHCHVANEDFNILIKRNIDSVHGNIESIIIKLCYQIIHVNHSGIYVNDVKVDIPSKISNLNIDKQGQDVVFSCNDIIVKWNAVDSLQVELPDKYKNETCGLCGDFNGFRNFDEGFVEGDQESINAFLDKWKADIPGEVCEHSNVRSVNCTAIGEICTETLLGGEMADCASRLDVQPYLDMCKQDYCACTIIDDVTNKGCIQPSECSCKYSGVTYSTGDQISPHSCENCTCAQGKWNCVKTSSCPGSCAVEGGSHITTFDQRLYTFHGTCSYILAQPCIASRFAVHGVLKPCLNSDEYETCLSQIYIAIKEPDNKLLIQSNGDMLLNGQTFSLPYDNGFLMICMPTSSYIIVTIDIGVQVAIKLSPIMEVYITVVSSYFGLMCGLCGNFNDQQLDDYAIPNGLSVQDPETFVNSWRSDLKCPKAITAVMDPCDMNFQKESFASMYCSKLNSKNEPFAVCQQVVPPNSYYEKCMYDTCMCKDSEKAMCAALASYVQACAKRGINITNWMLNYCEKYTECPPPMIFQYNVQHCQLTCKSLSVRDKSPGVDFTPTDGCTCPDGLYLSGSGECVLKRDCDCFHKGEFKSPGDIVHINGIECICKDGKLQCDYSQLEEKDCVLPMVYLNCSQAPEGSEGVECLKSCQNLHMDCFSMECVSGCICPEGSLADGKGGCVQDGQCTCFYNDKIYNHNEKAKIGCSLCTCDNRKWICDDLHPKAECMVYGEGNYITFDQKHYQFSGQCEYILAQDYCGLDNSVGTFLITCINSECSDTGLTCSKIFKMYFNEFILVLSNGKAVIINEGGKSEAAFNIWDNSIYLYIFVSNGMVLIWDKKTGFTVRIPESFQYSVCGLCGNFDGNSKNEYTTRAHCNVEDVLEFGNSWKRIPSCLDTEILGL